MSVKCNCFRSFSFFLLLTDGISIRLNPAAAKKFNGNNPWLGIRCVLVVAVGFLAYLGRPHDHVWMAFAVSPKGDSRYPNLSILRAIHWSNQ